MQHVLFQKGFRPFFILGALAAVGLVPYWAFNYQEPMTGEPGLESISWHSHEMVFGFTMAVIAGFLLTAVENWTSRPTARGWFLAALAGLWLLGRMVGLGGPAAAIGGMADLCFIPALSIAIGIPLVLAGSQRNFIFLALLPALWICDLLMHLQSSGLLPQSLLRTDLVAVDLVVAIMVLISGRIVPLFTRNALGDDSIQAIPTLNMAALVATCVVAVVDLVTPAGWAAAAVCAIAAMLVFARSIRWGFFKTLGQPVLWVLHVGHAWLWIGLALKAVAAVSYSVPSSIATHALTAVAIGTLTLGMMARVTLGHTGRPLQVSTAMTIGFVAVSASALLRVFGPWLRMDLTRPVLIASASLWLLAFALYLATSLRALLTPRPDGKPG